MRKHLRDLGKLITRDEINDREEKIGTKLLRARKREREPEFIRLIRNLSADLWFLLSVSTIYLACLKRRVISYHLELSFTRCVRGMTCPISRDVDRFRSTIGDKRARRIIGFSEIPAWCLKWKKRRLVLSSAIRSIRSDAQGRLINCFRSIIGRDKSSRLQVVACLARQRGN